MFISCSIVLYYICYYINIDIDNELILMQVWRQPSLRNKKIAALVCWLYILIISTPNYDNHRSIVQWYFNIFPKYAFTHRLSLASSEQSYCQRLEFILGFYVDGSHRKKVHFKYYITGLLHGTIGRNFKSTFSCLF